MLVLKLTDVTWPKTMLKLFCIKGRVHIKSVVIIIVPCENETYTMLQLN